MLKCRNQEIGLHLSLVIDAIAPSTEPMHGEPSEEGNTHCNEVRDVYRVTHGLAAQRWS
jgi:hypothetical protein